MLAKDQAKQALVSYAIEQALLDVGGDAMVNSVSDEMFSKYQCTIIDCYANPQYLNNVLHDIFGNSYTQIIDSIKKYLDEFTYQESITEFLDNIAE